jgi:hypothetical protein
MQAAFIVDILLLIAFDSLFNFAGVCRGIFYDHVLSLMGLNRLGVFGDVRRWGRRDGTQRHLLVHFRSRWCRLSDVGRALTAARHRHDGKQREQAMARVALRASERGRSCA